MKLIEAITKIDHLKHNTFGKEEKIAWLSTLDGMVKRQIIDTHEGADAQPFFTGYDADTPGDTELLVPAPYDELYLWWLSAQIDYHNAELAKYNNSIALFNTGYSVYAELYNREHMPLGAKSSFF